MANVMNFKRTEVFGMTKEEAFAKAPYSIWGDATQAYKNWEAKQPNGVSDADKVQFMLDYLAKKSKNAAGIGFSITLTPAVADTRERPYTFIDRKNEKGARKYKTTYQLIDKASNTIIAETNETKARAKEIGKKLYTDKGYKGHVVCKYTKQATEEGGDPIAFEMEYTPSINARMGKFLVFGIERA